MGHGYAPVPTGRLRRPTTAHDGDRMADRSRGRRRPRTAVPRLVPEQQIHPRLPGPDRADDDGPALAGPGPAVRADRLPGTTRSRADRARTPGAAARQP